MPFTAVSFDADGTLLHLDNAIRRGLEDVVDLICERHPGVGGRLSVEHLGQLRNAIAAERPGVEQAAIRRESFRRALERSASTTASSSTS